jgi:hypothetical protein
MSQIPQFLTHEKEYAEFRPVAECTFEAAVDMVDEALAYCKDHEIRLLLANLTGLSGFDPPSMVQRFQFATQWAATAGGRVCLALVARPEWVDAERIGVTMANNRGLRTDVFTDEAPGVKWIGSAGS